MKKVLSIMLSIVLVLTIFVGCASTSTSASTENSNDTTQEPGAAKIALLSGKRGSSSFIDEVYMGGDRAVEELGVQVDVVECMENADYETQARYLAETGEYELIIFAQSSVADVVKLMAGDYPEQKFSVVDTVVEGFENVRSVGAKDPEQAFLSGVLSGILTTGKYADVFPFTNEDAVLSYAGGGDTPTSRAGAAGYMAGAKYVNPDVEVLYTIVGSWNDPAKAKEITLQNIARGADIATGNCGSGIIGILEAAKEQGTYFIATSMADNDAEYSISCSVKKTDVFVYNEIKGVLENTWEAGHHTSGIADGICDISFAGLDSESKIPQEVMDVIEAVRAQIINEEIELPYDPNEVEAWAAENQYTW